MTFTLDPPVEEHIERCLAVIHPIFESVRQAHEGAIPVAVVENHYILGSIKGMVVDLLERTRFADWEQRNEVINRVVAKILDGDPEQIGNLIAEMEEGRDDPYYEKGVHDGEMRLEADCEERVSEVAYRLKRHLADYI